MPALRQPRQSQPARKTRPAAMKPDYDWTTALMIALGALLVGVLTYTYIVLAGSPCPQ